MINKPSTNQPEVYPPPKNIDDAIIYCQACGNPTNELIAGEYCSICAAKMGLTD